MLFSLRTTQKKIHLYLENKPRLWGIYIVLWNIKCQLLSHVWLFVTLWTIPYQAPLSMEFSRQDTGVGSHPLHQGIFPTQGSDTGLLHCRQILSPSELSGKPKNTGGACHFLLGPGIKPVSRMSPALAGSFFTTIPGKWHFPRENKIKICKAPRWKTWRWILSSVCFEG